MNTPFSTLTVKGGVVRVIDSATGDVAVTTSAAIEDAKYGWFNLVTATAVSAEFDSAVTRTGRLTLKVSTTDVTGRTEVWSALTSNGTVNAGSQKHLIPLIPGTTYKLTCYVKTTNAVASGVKIAFGVFASDLSAVQTYSSSFVAAGDHDWAKLTIDFTAGATEVYGVIKLSNRTAGNISDTWFDVNSMTLEEVTSITNSSSSPALYYPSATAVSSTDNIDQSQVVSTSAVGLANGFAISRTQSITPTKKNFNGIYFQKGANVGSPTYDVLFTLQTDNAGKPSGTILKSINITASTWDSITNSTDYLISLPYSVTANTKYHIVATASSMGDASNYRTIQWNSSVTYTGGSEGYYDSGAWTMEATKNFYFKTLYSKNTTNFTVSTDTQTVSVTASTADGWANGTVIDTATIGGIVPLTLAPGANTVYFSSNGASVADGTVDASLQMQLNTNKKLKVYLNNTWVVKTLKYWNGTAWVSRNLEYWNGSVFH